MDVPFSPHFPLFTCTFGPLFYDHNKTTILAKIPRRPGVRPFCLSQEFTWGATSRVSRDPAASDPLSLRAQFGKGTVSTGQDACEMTS